MNWHYPHFKNIGGNCGSDRHEQAADKSFPLAAISFYLIVECFSLYVTKQALHFSYGFMTTLMQPSSRSLNIS